MRLGIPLATLACLGCMIPMQPADPNAGGMYAQSPPPAGGEESPPAPDATGAQPLEQAGPQNYGLDLHNECRETVNLFIGDRPPFSSGTYTTLGSNTTTSYTGFAPETIWIVDASRNPVSSYGIGPGSQRIQILDSCTGFAPR